VQLADVLAGERAASLAAACLPVVVVNPAQVRAFAQALGKRAKTDPIDAAVIARFVEATNPEVRPLPDEETRMLSDLVTRRRQIIQMIVAEKQREKRAARRMKKSIARLLKALQKELTDIDADIDDAVRAGIISDGDLPTEEIEGKPAEKKMAAQLIEAMTGEFDPEAYRDEYREALMQVIESKVEGRETVSVAAPEESTNLVDLMAALQASVKAATSARDAKAEKPVSVAEAKARKAAGEPAGGARPAKRAAVKTTRPAARDEADEERPARKRKSA